MNKVDIWLYPCLSFNSMFLLHFDLFSSLYKQIYNAVLNTVIGLVSYVYKNQKMNIIYFLFVQLIPIVVKIFLIYFQMFRTFRIYPLNYLIQVKYSYYQNFIVVLLFLSLFRLTKLAASQVLIVYFDISKLIQLFGAV